MAAQRTLFSIWQAVVAPVLVSLGLWVCEPCAADLPVPNDVSHSFFSGVARKVQPAIVRISVTKPRGYEYARGLKRRSPAAVLYGSGVVIDAEGHILTNNHVVDRATRILVGLSDRSEYPAEIVGQDPDSDLALIRLLSSDPIDSSRVAHIGNSDSILVGDWVMAFGSPFGFHHTVSVGVISAKGRHLDSIEGDAPLPYQDFLQTDASINPGNSGGPLVDMAGNVVGINTAYNPGGVGIGFAIPINLAARVALQLRQHGEVIRGYLGISPQDLTSDIAEALEIPSVRGILVGEIEPGSPAERGGLQQGDVIVRLAGGAVEGAGEFLTQVARHNPQERLKLSVLRNGAPLTLTVLLGRRPPRHLALAEPLSDLPEVAWPGLEVENRWAMESRRLGISKTGQGVVVTYVVPGGGADQKGIVRGDLILEIDGNAIWNVRDYRQSLKQLQAHLKQDRPKPLLFLLLKKDQERIRFVALRP